MALAIDLPLAGSVKPVKSGGCVMYLMSIVAFGLICFTPAVKPTSKLLIRSFWTPPMKPILPDFDAQAAAAPTKNEPSLAAYTMDRTLGAGVVVGLPSAPTVNTTESMMAYGWLGFWAADAVVASPHRKPTATTRLLAPTNALMRSGRSLPSCAVGVDSLPVMPKSALALSRPAAAPSLNDLSPRPVRSKSRPTLLPLPSAFWVWMGVFCAVPALHLPEPPPPAAEVAAPPPAAVVVVPPAAAVVVA